MTSTQPFPWQLKMFERSLKKPLKLKRLLAILGVVQQEKCLLVTCGDNNGALNWHFRSHGGNWTWGDVGGEDLDEMIELLGEPVHEFPESHLPYDKDLFDCIVAIDVLEHLEDDQPFLQELLRVLRKGGRAIVTVPNGDPKLLVNRVKMLIGMRPDIYGHTRAGYTLNELGHSVERAGFRAIKHVGYSRFFTEMVELLINFGYVFVLSRKRGHIPAGRIAPSTSRELDTHSLAYRLYAILFPILKALSKLDTLLPGESTYAVIVEAVKPTEVAKTS